MSYLQQTKNHIFLKRNQFTVKVNKLSTNALFSPHKLLISEAMAIRTI